MAKNETPQRWTPTRRPVWFDEEDLSRMVAALRDEYSPFILSLEMPLSNWSVAMIFRLPKQPEFRLDIRSRKTWKSKEAAKYLDYLGFPKEFSDAYIAMYGNGANSNLASKKKFSVLIWKALFSSLSAYDNNKLRKILAPDKVSGKKWAHRLQTCGSTWAELKVPDRSVFRIIQGLYRETYNGELPIKAIESRARMYAKKGVPPPIK
jgi:hypothetical protein